MRLDLEKFDEKINYFLWKIQVIDVLQQLGLYNALRENISNIDNEKRDELDMKALRTIYMPLAKNNLGTLSSKEI